MNVTIKQLFIKILSKFKKKCDDTYATKEELLNASIITDNTVTEINNTINSKFDEAVNEIPTSLSQLTQDNTHRTVTDTEKNVWNEVKNYKAFNISAGQEWVCIGE
ncbi:MAG: hypothetical protein NC087_04375, partial [Anaeroplasma bactoclasticum]|nr:hypothetical protein [Anaeroplasma bactoclasticum]